MRILRCRSDKLVGSSNEICLSVVHNILIIDGATIHINRNL